MLDLSQVEARLGVDRSRIVAFCQKWRLAEFALFGSVLRADFRPDSDIDVLIRVAPNAPAGLHPFLAMQEELVALFGRPVDLVEREAVENSVNPIRKRSILSSTLQVYAAA